ncbi:MAG: sensor histidine kinase [Crocinitomicaceae bacterium]|nr:sensor histidine kinase [Crocinitomicaceae bacterium]
MIALGSFLLSCLVLLTLIIVQTVAKSPFSIFTLLLVPLITGSISFALFWFIVERFINKKIKMIYRIISNKKITDDSPRQFKITEDVLGKLTEDTVYFAEKQSSQIKELKEQAEFRKEFLGNLAHELKTPVFSIQGYILTLLEGGLEDEKVNRDFLERALNGVDRISNLLEDLDEISRFEFEQQTLKIKKIDIVALAKSTFKELEQKAAQKNIRFQFAKSYDSIFVKADEGKIHQVLVNLINNSIAYGNEGGMTTVRFHDLDMEKSKDGKGKILVEVADDGLGIEEKHLPRLFERFYRVDKSRARNIGGSGLGLAIVKHIVEAHGETIKVRSTEGVGSTFSFTLERT